MHLSEPSGATDAGAQMAATVATLDVIGRFGGAGSLERALNLYLSARPEHWIAKVRALERLGSLYLVAEDDLRPDDFVYRGVTGRITSIAAEAFGRARRSERD